MATSFERTVDGMFGRMLSWLTLPPARPFRERLEPAAEAAPPSAEKIEAFVAGAERATDQAAAAIEAAAGGAVEAAGDPLDHFVTGAERLAGTGDKLEDEILEALAAADGPASLAELRRRTGSEPADLGRQLKRLTEAGRVETIMDGMTKRYRRVARPAERGE